MIARHQSRWMSHSHSEWCLMIESLIRNHTVISMTAKRDDQNQTYEIDYILEYEEID
jgi:UTP:GlnB (protein PII) uridylyltransferase